MKIEWRPGRETVGATHFSQVAWDNNFGVGRVFFARLKEMSLDPAWMLVEINSGMNIFAGDQGVVVVNRLNED